MDNRRRDPPPSPYTPQHGNRNLAETPGGHHIPRPAPHLVTPRPMPRVAVAPPPPPPPQHRHLTREIQDIGNLVTPEHLSLENVRGEHARLREEGRGTESQVFLLLRSIDMSLEMIPAEMRIQWLHWQVEKAERALAQRRRSSSPLSNVTRLVSSPSSGYREELFKPAINF